MTQFAIVVTWKEPEYGVSAYGPFDTPDEATHALPGVRPHFLNEGVLPEDVEFHVVDLGTPDTDHISNTRIEPADDNSGYEIFALDDAWYGPNDPYSLGAAPTLEEAQILAAEIGADLTNPEDAPHK